METTRTDPNDPSSNRVASRRFVLLGTIVSGLLGISGLLGYLPGLNLLNRIGANLIPMAPATAISFITLSFVLSFQTRKVYTSYAYAGMLVPVFVLRYSACWIFWEAYWAGN